MLTVSWHHVVSAGRKSTEAAQRRWSSVVEEGQAIGAPGLQCRPQSKADPLVFVLLPPFCRCSSGRRSRGRRERKDREPARPAIDRRGAVISCRSCACQDRRDRLDQQPPSRVQRRARRGPFKGLTRKHFGWIIAIAQRATAAGPRVCDPDEHPRGQPPAQISSQQPPVPHGAH